MKKRIKMNKEERWRFYFKNYREGLYHLRQRIRISNQGRLDKAATKMRELLGCKS